MKQIVSRGHTRPLTEIHFVKDGDELGEGERMLLVSSAHDKTPMLRDGDTGNWIGTFKGFDGYEGHKGAVWCAKIDVRSRTLCATASGDFTAKLWCVSTGKELHELKHKHIVRSVDFSSDTEMLCSGCHDGVIRIFQTARLEAPPTERISPTSPREVIMKVLWLDENRILVGRKSGLLEAVDRRVDGVVQSLQMAGGGSIMDMELNAAHNTILIASGKTVSFHSIDSIDMQKSFTMPEGMHFQEEGGASLHPKGHLFMAGASDLWLREFDSNSGEVLNTFKGHHGPIRCVRYHPHGKMVASGSEDGTIRLWEHDSSQQLKVDF